MNVSAYVKKKNGVSIGSAGSLRNNLYRSLGAKNFPEFWNFWNPIFGYYLGIKIFKPLKKYCPDWMALITTFVFCGLIHDAVTMIFRGKMSFFFSCWFLLMGIVVAISKRVSYNLSHLPWILRALINVLIVGICFILTWYLNSLIGFY